jgi:spermidine synthase
VGLGAGTLAAYGRPGDYFRYYEINPDVVKLSSGSQPVFTYLRDSPARVDVELGDARLLLEREAAQGDVQRFDVLVLDAFAGGAVPVHLLTREAFETYWQHLDSDSGIIAVNITSPHIDLSPVLQGETAYLHLDSLTYVDTPAFPCKTSRWVLLARNPAALNVPGLNPAPLLAKRQIPPRLWTDDYSDIFRLERTYRIMSVHFHHRRAGS